MFKVFLLMNVRDLKEKINELGNEKFLPLKMTLEIEEITLVEKSEDDKEIDDLIAKMDYDLKAN